MKIKICGLFRDDDIDYVNEALPDYIGFVFAESRRKINPQQAARFRRRLLSAIVPAGVFVNAPLAEITALYRDGIIDAAQLHGAEDERYIKQLKDESVREGRPPIPVIKTIITKNFSIPGAQPQPGPKAEGSPPDYYLIDSGAGSGKTFDWNMLNPQLSTPHSSLLTPHSFFLAGGINMDNITKAMTHKPFALDISSGAETNGVKDREKILSLVSTVRKGTTT